MFVQQQDVFKWKVFPGCLYWTVRVTFPSSLLVSLDWILPFYVKRWLAEYLLWHRIEKKLFLSVFSDFSKPPCSCQVMTIKPRNHTSLQVFGRSKNFAFARRSGPFWLYCLDNALSHFSHSYVLSLERTACSQTQAMFSPSSPCVVAMRASVCTLSFSKQGSTCSLF